MNVEFETKLVDELANGELADGDIEGVLRDHYSNASDSVIDRWAKRVRTKATGAASPTSQPSGVVSGRAAQTITQIVDEDGEPVDMTGSVTLTGRDAAVWTKLKAAIGALKAAEREVATCRATVGAALSEIAAG